MLTPLHVLPMFGFAAIAFLMLGVILAVAVWIAFRSGQAGSTKLGGLGGCLVALALVFVAGLGAVACLVIAVVNAPNEFVRNGPVRKIEAHWPDVHKNHGKKGEPAAEPGKSAPEDRGDAQGEKDEKEEKDEDAHGMHIRVEIAGGDSAAIARWFREHTEGDFEVRTEPIDGPDGRRTRIDIRIPVSDAEMRDLRNDLERDLPNLNLPRGVTIELKGDEDD